MRLLFVTQVVDRKDPILGFVIKWIEEFVNHGVKMTVFARRLVDKDLPMNVYGQDLGQPVFFRVLKLWYYSIKFRKQYDAVFVHMTPQIVVIGWPVWCLLRKPIYMWYMHKSVTWWLKLALLITKKTFTASDLSLRVNSPKKTVVGHGIPTDIFRPIEGVLRKPIILAISRIQPSKKFEDTLSFLAEFKTRYPNIEWSLRVIGSSIGHEKYLEFLKQEAIRLGIDDVIFFESSIEYAELPKIYSEATAFVSTSTTGSIDKVVLEALACNVTVFALGDEYQNEVGVVDLKDKELSCKELRRVLLNVVDNGALSRESIIKKHDLKRLIRLLITKMT